MKKIIALSALPVIILLLVAFQNPIDFEHKESVLMQAIMTHLNRMHFSPVTLDDSYSEDVFDEYLERLDPNKQLLLSSEIAQLNQYRDQIDDEVQKTTFEFFDASVELIDAADQRASKIFNDLINSSFEFDQNESVETDEEKNLHCDTEGELSERWRKILKLQILRDVNDQAEKQNAEDFEGEKKDFETLVEDSRIRLKKRMDRWFNQRLKSRRVDRLASYVNTITALYDPHTNYMMPKDKEDFDLRMSNRLEGIGARLTQDGDYVKIVDVIPGGPAWKQGGLEVDDMIVKVAQEDEVAVDVVGWHIDDVIGLIRGKKGTHVRLIIRKVDNSEVEIPITRDIIVFDEGYVRSFILDHEDYKDKIGYIMLPSFYFDSGRLGGRASGADVKAEVEKLKSEGVRGIILDLRNNGGGSLRDVVEMSGLFIEKGPIVQVKSRGVDPDVLYDRDPSVVYDGPLVVMVNQGSASASEILAAAMQDYERAVIIGSKTFGKGTVQRFFDLDRSLRGNEDIKPLGQVKITTQKFFRINGGATQLKGVTPDIELPSPYQLFDRGERDYDHAMAWSKIDKADYNQSVYDLNYKQDLIKRSQQRIDENETFQKINEYSKILKQNRDRTIFSLNYDEFSKSEKVLDEELKKYDDLYPKIEAFDVQNLSADLVEIQSDSTKIERNERFVKALVKDIELEEATAVIHDMIHWEQ
jgi:carboxyl-terminal processing protease